MGSTLVDHNLVPEPSCRHVVARSAETKKILPVNREHVVYAHAAIPCTNYAWALDSQTVRLANCAGNRGDGQPPVSPNVVESEGRDFRS